MLAYSGTSFSDVRQLFGMSLSEDQVGLSLF